MYTLYIIIQCKKSLIAVKDFQAVSDIGNGVVGF